MKTELRSRGDYPFKGINVFQYLTLTLCYNNLCFEVEPQYIYIHTYICLLLLTWTQFLLASCLLSSVTKTGITEVTVPCSGFKPAPAGDATSGPATPYS